jgi:hypothetical protein
MSWTRFDDNWSDRMSQLGLTFQARVHYMSMIQFCSRTNKFDGALRPVDARRASDVDDPDACINALITVGLVTRHVTPEGERLQIVEINQHVPPPHLREQPRKASGQARTQRWRLHKTGDHSQCLPENCPEAASARHVTRHIGTGQDRHGQEEVPEHASDVREGADGTEHPPPCGVDLVAGGVAAGTYKPCSECGSTSGDCSCWDEPRWAPTTPAVYDPSMEPHGWEV